MTSANRLRHRGVRQPCAFFEFSAVRRHVDLQRVSSALCPGIRPV
ncbi:putative leader peptide [Streptacidiphilus jiangxiensis]|nr:putative leader peptide [Streptacidiphilus jiangxiensis]